MLLMLMLIFIDTILTVSYFVGGKPNIKYQIYYPVLSYSVLFSYDTTRHDTTGIHMI